MANSQEDILVQRISLIRENQPPVVFDRSFLRELTFVETADLSGPRLMFVVDDYYRIIRDDIGVKEMDVLEVVFSDRFQHDGLDKTIRFVVLTMPIHDRFLTFNCMEQSMWALKTPARGTLLFTQMPVKAILQKLAPGLRYDVGSFPVLNDYHLLPGMRPSKLIRQMAQEYGAICFWQRGTLVFKKLKELYALPPAIEYHHNDPTQKNRVLIYSKPNTGAIIRDIVERNFTGWDMVAGVTKATRFTAAPVEFTSAPKGSLDNLTEIPKPVIDFNAAGNGYLLPGIAMALKWNTERPDLPIDESLPAKAVIGMVAHSWKPQSYFCQVGGIRP